VFARDAGAGVRDFHFDADRYAWPCDFQHAPLGMHRVRSGKDQKNLWSLLASRERAAGFHRAA